MSMYFLSLFIPYIVKEVVNRKARTRRHTELSIKSAARRLSLGELRYLLEQLDRQMCVIQDSDLLQVLTVTLIIQLHISISSFPLAHIHPYSFTHPY